MRIMTGGSGALQICCDEWPGFVLADLLPVVEADGQRLELTAAAVVESDASANTCVVQYDFSGICRLNIAMNRKEAGHIRLTSRLLQTSSRPLALGKVVLLEAVTVRTAAKFGSRSDQIVVYNQSSYHGKVVILAAAASDQTDRPDTLEPNEVNASSGQTMISENVWVGYDRQAGQALLVGFESNERWNGIIELAADQEGAVQRWSVGFANSDLLLHPGEQIELESLVIWQGSEPLDLLDAYGSAVASRHRPGIPAVVPAAIPAVVPAAIPAAKSIAAPAVVPAAIPAVISIAESVVVPAANPAAISIVAPTAIPAAVPVSWCSWYPFRLGVSEDRLLETAQIAAQRLQPLGLSIIEADLGWELDQLPSSFTENSQFPHGLKWLSGKLADMGFQLGCWKAPYQISEFDPIASEHPEWLIAGGDGGPAVLSTWFWKPHGNVYALDLTHPGAQNWLRQQTRSLAERDVGYYKVDFIGQPDIRITSRRFDRTIAAGAETARIGARIIREELPEALILNCGGPDMPGTGQWPLLYTCWDTGNTGQLSWTFQRSNFLSLACHLWKNRRWGIIQASCLCVGLPGTLEEARIRATAAFFSGGQIDISDTLTTLPEDRWAVLEATLPPLGQSARAIDLFEPVYDPGKYEALCSGEQQELACNPHPAGSVWHLHMARGWDEWELVAIFNLETPPDGEQAASRYSIPLERIGLNSGQRYWAYEFWSGQFLGEAPAVRHNPGGYEHPGDMQDLLIGANPTALELAFTGPSVKLICLRATRPYPWIVGTSFHQSCGAELADVQWDAEQLVLSGCLLRPSGHSGYVLITDGGLIAVSAEVNERSIRLVASANGAWKLKLATDTAVSYWHVQFAAADK